VKPKGIKRETYHQGKRPSNCARRRGEGKAGSDALLATTGREGNREEDKERRDRVCGPLLRGAELPPETKKEGKRVGRI